MSLFCNTPLYVIKSRNGSLNRSWNFYAASQWYRLYRSRVKQSLLLGLGSSEPRKDDRVGGCVSSLLCSKADCVYPAGTRIGDHSRGVKRRQCAFDRAPGRSVGVAWSAIQSKGGFSLRYPGRTHQVRLVPSFSLCWMCLTWLKTRIVLFCLRLCGYAWPNDAI